MRRKQKISKEDLEHTRQINEILEGMNLLFHGKSAAVCMKALAFSMTFMIIQKAGTPSQAKELLSLSCDVLINGVEAYLDEADTMNVTLQ
jgi:hypothetical protein